MSEELAIRFDQEAEFCLSMMTKLSEAGLTMGAEIKATQRSVWLDAASMARGTR